MIYRAKAPLRISFCGGGTDVSPYPEERGGVVLSATINRYAFASLHPLRKPILRLRSLDFDETVEADLTGSLELDGRCDLLKGVVGYFRDERDGEGLPSGLEILSHTDAPPGSGLGASSTMVTTLVGVCQEWLRIPLAPYDIAELTYHIERERVRISGGRQDQYAAVFGGFNFIEFHRDHTIVNPLRIRRDTQNELESRLLLVYSGQTRLSARIVERQTRSYQQRKSAVVEALDAMKELAIRMKNELLRDDLDAFGRLLHEAWLHKKQLDSGISNTHIDALYEEARRLGALGGKILGAGGGGYLLLYCPYEEKHRIAEALRDKGGQPAGFALEGRGLQTWAVRR
ncbi:MAG: GHMP kinase [Candidatus Eisenbacteria bacterium]|nr:GHMP kinase [Candidatus Eisenbacteria bacterium]